MRLYFLIHTHLNMYVEYEGEEEPIIGYKIKGEKSIGN